MISFFERFYRLETHLSGLFDFACISLLLLPFAGSAAYNDGTISWHSKDLQSNSTDIYEQCGVSSFFNLMIDGYRRAGSTSGDTFPGVKIGSFTGYDCFFREWGERFSRGGDSKWQVLDFNWYKNRNKLAFGGRYNQYKYEYPVPEYNIGIDADFSSADLYGLYQRSWKHGTVGGNVECDVKGLKGIKNVHGMSILRNAVRSSVVDFRLFLSADRCSFGGAAAFENRSALSGYLRIVNEANENYRIMDIDIDKNCFNLHGWMELPLVYIDGDLVTNLFTGNRTEDPMHLRCQVTGTGVTGRLGCVLKSFPYKPRLHVEIGNEDLSVTMTEKTSSAFATLDSNDIIHFKGNLLLSLFKGVQVTAFLEKWLSQGGKGYFEIYPFTSWGVVFDIPDKYKITDFKTIFINGGLRTDAEVINRKSHLAKIYCNLSYAEILWQYSSAELVRYMGLLPVYQNEQQHYQNKRFLIVYPGIQWTVQREWYTLQIYADQLIPVELKNEKHDAGSGTGIKDTKSYTFGGFRARLGIEFYKKRGD